MIPALKRWWSGPLTCTKWTLIPSLTEKTLATLLFIDGNGKKQGWVVSRAKFHMGGCVIENPAPIEVDALVDLHEHFELRIYVPIPAGQKGDTERWASFPLDRCTTEEALLRPDARKPDSIPDQLAYDMLSFFLDHSSRRWFIEDSQKYGPFLYDATYDATGKYAGARLYQPDIIHRGFSGPSWKGFHIRGTWRNNSQHAVFIREPDGQEVLYCLDLYLIRFARKDADPEKWAVTEPFWRRWVGGDETVG